MKKSRRQPPSATMPSHPSYRAIVNAVRAYDEGESRPPLCVARASVMPAVRERAGRAIQAHMNSVRPRARA